jgi:hypothetical protein
MKLEIFMIVLVVLITVGFCGRGCLVDNRVAYNAAEKAGFTEVQVLNKAWFAVALRGCSNSDAAMFTVNAKNNKDQTINFIICTGWLFKNATIRY